MLDGTVPIGITADANKPEMESSGIFSSLDEIQTRVVTADLERYNRVEGTGLRDLFIL